MHDLGNPVAATVSSTETFVSRVREQADLVMRDGVDMERLVGREHLFGRMRHLRSGFMVEPISRLTLQPDGRVTGYGHPNEGGWTPYGFGEVAASRAFAFISSRNGYIPSSTWTQSLGRIAVGHFCDEPEGEQAAQRLCLIPEEPAAEPVDIIYLVASCLKFYERTVPRLLEDLRNEGVSHERVKVVVNGAERNADRTIEGVEHAFSTHDGWEWSALFEAPRRWWFDYAFLLHDTALILPGFRRQVERFNRYLTWDHLPASPLGRCLIGHYSRDFLQRLGPWLERTHEITKREGIIAEAGAELLLRARTALVLGDARGKARAAEWGEQVDWFNTGVPRVRRRFPAVHLDKFLHAGPTDPRHL